MKKTIQTGLIILVSLLAFASAVFAVWNDPTATAPGDNTNPPINNSATPQIKTGGLSLGSLIVAGGIQLGTASTTCDNLTDGTIRFEGGIMQICSDDVQNGATTTTNPNLPPSCLNGQVPVYNVTTPGWECKNTWGQNGIDLIYNAGNVGIGTTTPSEKLDVAGKIRFSDNGSTISRSPRVIYTTDDRAGCPAPAAANTDLFSQNFTVDNDSQGTVMLRGIANRAGRVDTTLYLNGTEIGRHLTITDSSTWNPVNISWGGDLPAGSHTISVRANHTDVWGCGPAWGSITTTIFEN